MRSDGERLNDIVDAAEKIALRVARGRSVFELDEDLQFALVHLIEILGEASAQLSPELRAAHQQVPWRQVIGMRNRVVHGYFDVDATRIWEAAELEVPRFAQQVRSILSGLQGDAAR